MPMLMSDACGTGAAPIGSSGACEDIRGVGGEAPMNAEPHKGVDRLALVRRGGDLSGDGGAGCRGAVVVAGAETFLCQGCNVFLNRLFA